METVSLEYWRVHVLNTDNHYRLSMQSIKLSANNVEIDSAMQIMRLVGIIQPVSSLSTVSPFQPVISFSSFEND